MSLQPALPALAQPSVRPEYVFSEPAKAAYNSWGGGVSGKGFPLRQLPKHLKRNPASRVHHTVQDYVPNTLRALNMTSVVR